MHHDRDAIADQLRERVLDYLTRDEFLRAVRDDFVRIATEDDFDPIDHPGAYGTANPGQKAALDTMMEAFIRYVDHSRIDDDAIDGFIDGFEAAA